MAFPYFGGDSCQFQFHSLHFKMKRVLKVPGAKGDKGPKVFMEDVN